MFRTQYQNSIFGQSTHLQYQGNEFVLRCSFRRERISPESICIDQRRVLNIRKKRSNVVDWFVICSMTTRITLTIFFVLPFVSHCLPLNANSSDRDIRCRDWTNARDRSKCWKKMRIEPLLDFWQNLSEQINASPSKDSAINNIKTTLNQSRVDYFIKNLADCNVIRVHNGFITIECE